MLVVIIDSMYLAMGHGADLLIRRQESGDGFVTEQVKKKTNILGHWHKISTVFSENDCGTSLCRRT